MNFVESFGHGRLSVVVHDLDRVGAFASPYEAQAPLVVDANTVLAPAIALQCFQMVTGRDAQ